MKLGATSLWRTDALDRLLHRLYDELLKEPLIRKSFIITEEQRYSVGHGYTHFKIRDIPIETEHLVIPSDVELKLGSTKIYKKYTMKERLKILFRGRL